MVASIPEDTGWTAVDGETLVLDRPWCAVRAARRLLGEETDECTAALLAGPGNRLIAAAIVARGWAQAARLTGRRVMALVEACGATGAVLVRNRVDGDTTPYPSEERVAAILQQVTQLAGVRLLDHVIVGTEGRYWSAMEEGRGPQC